MRRAPRLLVLAAAAAVLVACGKKGPPLPPLHLVPAAPGDVTVARLGPDVHLRFTVPSENAGAPGPVEIERVEIFAASIAAGAPAPPNREFLTATYRVGTIDVRPPAARGEPAADTADDTRPGPGEAATFVEPLTTAMLNPSAPAVPEPAPPAVETPPAAAAKPAPPAYPTRIYAIRGVTSRGRPGNPSTRVTVPLVGLPAPPGDVAVDFTETAFVVTWTPPVADVGGSPLRFHVYRAEAPTEPLQAAPTAEASLELPGVAFGVEQCFAVRTVLQIADVAVGSDASPPACATPRDIFPPAPPAGLNGVATRPPSRSSGTPARKPTSAGTWSCAATRRMTHCSRSRPSPSARRRSATRRLCRACATRTPSWPWTRRPRPTGARRRHASR
jgi:predicted small lipoprotein YifL